MQRKNEGFDRRVFTENCPFRISSNSRCRDTFASLKKTCRKLGVSFWEYLTDRVSGKNLIPTLGELIAQKARESLGTLAETVSVSLA